MGFYKTIIGLVGLCAALFSIIMFSIGNSGTSADYAVLAVLLCLSAILMFAGQKRFKRKGPDGFINKMAQSRLARKTKNEEEHKRNEERKREERLKRAEERKRQEELKQEEQLKRAEEERKRKEDLQRKESSITYDSDDANGTTVNADKSTQMEDASQKGEKIRKLAKYRVDHPSLNLLSDEICYYQGKAKSYHEKNVVVGRRRSGAGVSFRVAKGVSVHTGGGGSENIRSQVGESYDGMFFLTNKRVVLTAMKYGFDLPLSKITSINADPKHGFMFFSAGKAFTVLTKDYRKIASIMALIDVEEDTPKIAKPSKRVESSASKKDNYAEELRELKVLLDEGVLTQEEYAAKKKQILGI